MIIKHRFVIFSKVIFNTALVSLILSVMCQHTLAQESKILKVNSFNHDSNAAQKQRLDDHSSKRKIKVAAAQILTDHDDIEKNHRKIVQKIKEAKAEECEIVLFHEGCLTGYPDGKSIHGIDFAKVQQAEKEIIDLAKELKIGVLLGSSSNENDEFQNYVLIIDEKGNVLGKYEKTWRAGEPHYRAGSGPVIFTIAGVEATVIICHDLRYPALARLGVAAGAQIIFIANNEAGVFKEYKMLGYQSMQISRATENMVYAVMANSPADPQNILRPNCSHGNSKIVDTWGNIIDEANVFEERLVVGVLDLKKSSRTTVLRTMGQDPETKEKYGVWCEIPEYADWIQEGLKLVQRLDGSGDIPDHLKSN
jgi:predicted amidohydrolase